MIRDTLTFRLFVDLLNKNGFVEEPDPMTTAEGMTMPKRCSAKHREAVCDAAKEAQVFIFPPNFKKLQLEEREVIENRAIDLPFKTCFIEWSNNGSMSYTDEKGTKVSISGILIHELSPRNHFFAAHLWLPNTPPPVVNYILYVDSTHAGIGPYCWYKAICNGFLNYLNNSQTVTGKAKIKERIKIKNPLTKSKEIIKIYPIYIRPRNEVENDSSPLAHSIEWSCRFKVRGHWRKVRGVGRDRDGEYCVEGATWIVDYTKGKETLPLVERARFVQT